MTSAHALDGSMLGRTRPEAIDTRVVFGVYAAITVTSGLFVYLWPEALGVPALFPEITPPGPWATTRVVAALVAASGMCAALLAGVRDPLGRRRALYAFAAAHLVFGGLFLLQWIALFDRILPAHVGSAPLLTGCVLLYLAVTGPSKATVRRTLLLGGDHPGAPGTAVVARHDLASIVHADYDAHIEQVARQQERTRLARDLHDAVKQQLFAIQTAAATVDARFDSDVPGARAALADVRTAARDAMAEMEAMIEQLSTAPLENTGLVDLLKRQCEALQFRTGADVRVAIGELPPRHLLPPETAQNLFRGAQEALGNIGRHARASRVDVSLGARGRQFELTVKDDGAGFDPMSAPKGMGLDNMAARAGALNGAFTLHSTPGQGTTVSFSIPFLAGSAARYLGMALASALMLAVGIRYAASPWALGLAVIAGIATARYVMAFVKVCRRAATGSFS